MARGDRTPIETDPMVNAVFQLLLNATTGTDFEGRVAEWERPKDDDMEFYDPPFLLVREYPSAGQFNGPLSDSKVDTIIRIQILCLGRSPSEARKVRDASRRYMQRDALEALIPDRAVMDLSFMVTGGGDTRNDDTMTPFHMSVDLYELWTTPDPEEGS